MKTLIKKEFMLCVHQTMYIFLIMPFLVFVPNYPYEVIFFFGMLSTFFYGIKTRENKDIAFSCALPINKADIPISKILVTLIFQSAIFLLTLICTIIKEFTLPSSYQFNYAGLSANMVMCGNGLLLLGIFNIIFFSLYFCNVNKVGIPFLLAIIPVFLIVVILIVLRFTTNLYGTTLNGTDDTYATDKLISFFICFSLFIGLTVSSVLISKKVFVRQDLVD